MGDDRPVVIVERSSGGLGGFVLGALIGAAVALLFAPQSGEETREQLRQRGRRLRKDVRAKADEWQERLEDGYERARERLEDGLESARRTVQEKRAGARDAIDAGKAAVHTARDELDRQLADARAVRKGGAEDDEAEV